MVLTVIMPTYNRADRLALAVTSLLRQREDVPLDILIVDDGSTDETEAVIRELSEDHPEIRSVWQPNAGVCAARNTGLANLRDDTEYVTFLDSDDTSPAGTLAAQLNELSAEPDAELAYGRLEMVEAIDPVALTPLPDTRKILMTGIQLSCALFRRDLLERMGGFDPEFCQAEDTDLMLRIFESGVRFIETDTVCLYYLRHPGNMTKKLDESRRYFILALRKSMLRRKANPDLTLVTPAFDVQQVGQAEFY